MKKRNKVIISTLLMVMSISLGLINNHESGVKVVEVAESLNEGLEGDPINTDQTAKEYYSSISSSLTGDSLLSALRKLNSTKRKKTVGYSNLWDYYNKTDYNPNNRSQYVAYYRGTYASKGQMNREHVWPNSRGGNLIEADIHIIRPTLTADNSSRGNAFYVEGGTSQSGWDPYADGMTERYRGDAARIIFYGVVANSQLSLVDLSNDKTGNKTMGKLSDLLKWNLEYPVDDTEIRRNEGAEDIQGNRNPFIDDRSLACKIWGDYNENTKNVCSKVLKKDPPTSLTLSPANSTINVGSSLTLNVNVTPSNASSSVTWVSSNPSVASVSSGVVKGISEGTTTISAISSLDSSVRGEANIVVRDVKSISISGTPVKTVYEEGDKFDPKGLTVTAKYSDNTTSVVSNSNIEWLDGVTSNKTLSKGSTSVIAKYGSIKTTYSGITVNEKVQPDGCVLINDTSELKTGDKVVIAYKEGNVVAGELNEKYLSSKKATFSADKQKIEDYSNGLVFTLEGNQSGWTFSNQGNKLGVTSEKKLSFIEGTNTWSISISSGVATIESTKSGCGTLQYNKNSPRFTTYKSSQEDINLYRISKSSVNPDPTPDPDPDPTPIPTEKTLVNLSVEGSLAKLSYYEGETFDSTGLRVLAEFSNGDIENVTSEIVWSPNKLSVSDTKVVGTYTYGNKTLSVEVKNISVSQNISNEVNSNKGCGKASMNILYFIALISVLGVVIKKK